MNNHKGHFVICIGALLATSVANLNAAHPIEPIIAAETTGRESIFVQPPAEPTIGTEIPTHSIVSFRNISAPELRENFAGKQMTPPPSPRRWQFILGLTAGFFYDDNIFLTHDNKQEDFVFTIAPTIGVLFGDPNRNTLSLIYTPTFIFFADNSGENNVEQAVDVAFTHRTDRWRFTLNAGYRQLSGADRQLGERTDRQLWTAGARVNYIVSDKTSLELALGMNYVDYNVFFDTIDVVGQFYVDYIVTGKTSLGLGVGLGYAKSEGGPEQFYEQLNMRVKYAATAKLVLTASGGVEFRQAQGGDNQVTPIWGLGVTYLPFDSTTINLDAYRRIRPSSIFNDANYIATGIVLSVRQRVAHKFYFTLAGGYEASEYHAITHRAGNVERDDHYFFIRPSLEFRVADRVSVELFYEHRENNSDFPDFEFANNRAGVRVGVFF